MNHFDWDGFREFEKRDKATADLLLHSWITEPWSWCPHCGGELEPRDLEDHWWCLSCIVQPWRDVDIRAWRQRVNPCA